MPHHSAACRIDALGDARHFRRAPRRPVVDMLGDLLETRGVRGDEIVVEPVVLDHQVQDAIEQRDVAAGLDRQEQVAGASDGRDARIDDDDARPVLAGLPHVVRRDRGALGDIGAADPHDLGAENVGPRIGGPVDAEGKLVAGAGADHAQPAVVVDVGRFQAHAGELAHQVRLLVRQARAAEDGEGVGPVRRLNALDGRGDLLDGRFVSERAKSLRGGRIALVGVQQAIGMRALQVALDALGTEHPAIERELVPRLETDDPIVLDLELDAALLAAEAAMRLDQAIDLGAVRAVFERVGAVRAEAIDNV